MSITEITGEGTGPQTTIRAANPGRGQQTAPRVPDSGAGPPSAPVAQEPAIDPQAAREYIEQVQEVLDRVAPAPHKITFRRDDTTNGFVIEVRNPDGSMIRQYPPETLLKLRRKLDEMSGMVIDEMT
jgi:uncharacterized FlaG/YvyC family protein